jgi:hypothetical protein
MSPLRHSSFTFNQVYKFRRDRRHSKEAILKMPLSWFANKFYIPIELSDYEPVEHLYQTYSNVEIQC